MKRQKKIYPRCYYCGRKLNKKTYSEDHLKPKAFGGTDHPNNKVPACKDCNVTKGCISLEQFRAAVAQQRKLIPVVKMKFFGEMLTYEERLEKQKALRKERKLAGLCMRCGKVPARPNRVDCEECSIACNNSRRTKVSKGICPYCKEQNPTIEGKKWCLSCSEKASEKGKLRRRELKESGICISCRINGAIKEQVQCGVCAEESREYHRNNKKLCFEYYGNICKCCNIEFDERFLTLDHINNDGSRHRKEIGKSSLYRWTIKNNFPDTLQTLCFNCNMGKSVNGGSCPHLEYNKEIK